MSPDGGHDAPLSLSFPRVSGDEPEADHIGLVEIKFSPRERG